MDGAEMRGARGDGQIVNIAQLRSFRSQRALRPNESRTPQPPSKTWTIQPRRVALGRQPRRTLPVSEDLDAVRGS